MSFASRIRRLASETAVYGVSSVVGRLINYLLFPFYTNVFAPEEYGVVVKIYTMFVFLNVAYQYGMESAYLKFASDQTDISARRPTFSAASWSLAGTSLIFSLLIVAFKQPIGALLDLPADWLFLLNYAAVILALDAVAIVPFAELRLQSRPVPFAVIRVVNVVVNVMLNIVLIVGLRMGIEAVLLANVVASAVSLVLLSPSYRSLLAPAFDRRLWAQLLRFGLPFLPAGIGYAVADRVNIFFLGTMSPQNVERLYGARADLSSLESGVGSNAFGDYVVGVYGGATKLAIFMMLTVQMFRYAWQPFFLNHARDDDAKPLFARVFTLFVAATTFVLLAVTFYMQEFVALPLPGGRYLVEPRFWLGLFIVPIALLGYQFQGMYYNFAAGAYIEKQTRYFVHCALAGAAVALAMNLYLVPRYGMLGAAWATTAAYFVMATLLWWLVRRFYSVPYQWGKVAAIAFVGAVAFVAWKSFPELQRWHLEAVLLSLYAGSLFVLRIFTVSSVRAMVSRS